MESSAPPVSDSFPLDLLNRSRRARYDYFKKRIVWHSRLTEAEAVLWRTAYVREAGSIIFLYGPPGVGKSALCRKISERLSERSSITQQGKDWEPPALLVEARAPEKGNFDWPYFYRAVLLAMKKTYPSSHLLASLPNLPDRLENVFFSLLMGRASADLRQALETVCEQSPPSALIVDEAQHIGKAAFGRKVQDQMDVMKSFARQSDTLLILSGTYELLSLRNLSGQLSRRSFDVHFKRYGIEEEDLKNFRSTLWAFQRHLPLPLEPDLLRHWEFCYVRSIGCVGALKDWLKRALAATLERGERTIKISILQQTALSIDKCEAMAAEAVEGERRLEAGQSDSSRLLKLLGVAKSTLSKGVPAEAEPTFGIEGNKNPRTLPPTTPRRRKATRYKVGLD